MSTLTSASTLDQVIASYADNASYQEDQDPGKARAFVTACRILLLKLPSKSAHGRGGSIELSVAEVRMQLEAAQRWLATSPAATNDVAHPTFQNFRDYPPGMGYPFPYAQ